MRRLGHRLLRLLPVPVALGIERAKRTLLPASIGPNALRARRIVAAHVPDGRVRAGPFRGMRYVDEAVGSAYAAKLFGNYEHELHDAIDGLIAGGIDRLVDVGAAEGYYAVGLAIRLPALRVVTFDVEPRARYLQRRLARLNGVADRVDVRGAGDPAAIEDALAGARRPLVICDCEGAEDALLRPDLTPSLRHGVVIVELHDQFVPGVSGRVRERFAATHAIAQVDEADEIPPAFTAGLPAADHDALREGRAARQFWFVMTPRGV